MSLGVAVAAGALIGAEREQARLGRTDEGDADAPRESAQHRDFGGIRTFPLISLIGALSALSTQILGPWVLGAALLGVSGLLVASYLRTATDRAPGLSTEVAAILAFLLGATAALPQVLPGPQRYLLVASCAAAVMVVLALKRPLHGFASKVSADDVYATAKFVILALVVLPMLPDAAYGPLDVLNPRAIGIMVALVAGVSFAGYVAARVVGSNRGLVVTGLLGGLVSSTAVTLTFSGRARETPSLAPACAIAILAACATMFMRVLVIVSAVDRPLFSALLWPVGTMALVGAAIAIGFYWRATRRANDSEAVPLQNPFRLMQALKFGLVYAGVLFVSKAAQMYLGSGGVLVSSVIAGVADVDAITLSLSNLHKDGLATTTAATGITLAIATNTVVKSAIALSLGGSALGKLVAGGVLLPVAAGGVTLLLLR